MKKIKVHQTTIITAPEIVYQDKNKLELKVASKTIPDKYYYVTIKRRPPSVTCNCISGEIRNYCYHIKQVKGYVNYHHQNLNDFGSGLQKSQVD